MSEIWGQFGLYLGPMTSQICIIFENVNIFNSEVTISFSAPKTITFANLKCKNSFQDAL